MNITDYDQGTAFRLLLYNQDEFFPLGGKDYPLLNTFTPFGSCKSENVYSPWRTKILYSTPANVSFKVEGYIGSPTNDTPVNETLAETLNAFLRSTSEFDIYTIPPRGSDCYLYLPSARVITPRVARIKDGSLVYEFTVFCNQTTWSRYTPLNIDYDETYLKFPLLDLNNVSTTTNARTYNFGANSYSLLTYASTYHVTFTDAGLPLISFSNLSLTPTATYYQDDSASTEVVFPFIVLIDVDAFYTDGETVSSTLFALSPPSTSYTDLLTGGGFGLVYSALDGTCGYYFTAAKELDDGTIYDDMLNYTYRSPYPTLSLFAAPAFDIFTDKTVASAYFEIRLFFAPVTISCYTEDGTAVEVSTIIGSTDTDYTFSVSSYDLMIRNQAGKRV